MDVRLVLLICIVLATVVEHQVVAGQKHVKPLEETLGEIFRSEQPSGQLLEQPLEQNLAQKIEQKLEEKLDKKIDEKLEHKLNEKDKPDRNESSYNPSPFNRLPMTMEEAKERGLKCIPGHTVMKMEEQALPNNTNVEEENVTEEDGRRSHMNSIDKDESCKICVCSVEGLDEYCKQRPARNVNECIRSAQIIKNFNKNVPYDDLRVLAYSIRRGRIGTISNNFIPNIGDRPMIPMDSEEKRARGLKCTPGLTTIKLSDANKLKNKLKATADDSSEEDDYVDNDKVDELVYNAGSGENKALDEPEEKKRNILNRIPKGKHRLADKYDDGLRRTHMNSIYKGNYGKTCQVCVCSVNGLHEYCSNRPVEAVNECVRLEHITNNYHKNIAFDKLRSLSLSLRRDYIWHNDEIPYEANAKCRRGTSFYSNSMTANNTDIDIPSDIESLLDYPNQDICFYCICATDGRFIHCIKREPWVCEYYRFLKTDNAVRDMYRDWLEQDRPSYFRTLSYRLRRTMDDDLNDFVVNVNENKKGKCIPFVSDYTDCTEETLCSGCIRCSCTANSEWTCNTVHECKDTDYILDDRELDSGFNTIAAAGLDEKKRDNTLGLNPFVNENDRLLEDEKAMDDEIMKIMRRSKRSVANEHVDDHHGHIDGLVNEHVTAGSHNGTVRFYHTVDELNEDTLMNVNTSGTVHAKKVAPLHLPKLTRRTGLFDNINNHNITAMDSLHIEYNQPKVYAHHITDNKIDTATQVDHHIDGHKAKFDILSSNVTQKLKDDILSKIVVNELKTGVETIGDAKGPVMSNITFTPENDTLTAMAFIAGNLLNKLWNMEKTANDESVETDRLKHEKIADLLDLFKDPLTLRQESFLKDALSKLSDALDKTHDLSNVTLCEKIEQTKNSLNKTQPCEKTIETPTTTTKQPEVKIKIARKTRKNADSSKVAVVSKIKYVMDLIKKFEKVKKQINKLQPVEHTSQESVVYSENPQIKDVFEREHISKDDMSNMNVFGTVLEKITKLLVPKKDSKKPLNKIRKLNVFRDDDYVLNKLKDTFGIDIGKISLSVKDKLLLDYLTGPQSSKCTLAEEEQKVKAMEKVEGDILLNLSEFFKIKSFTDLFNLMHPQKNSRKRNNIIQVSTTTESPQPVLESIYQPNLPKKIINTIANAENKDRFTDKKEKLKKHLKTLLDDLVDLQKEKGISPKDRKLRIADALPCIYNVLNFDKDIQKDLDKIKSKYVVANNSNTVSDILNHFKTELKFASSPTRRSNQYIPEKRPRSAIVWERAVKNALNKTGVATRRMEILKVKNFKELKKSMSDIEGHSKTYKAKALVNVPVQSRLMLLRTLQMEATNYIQVLTDIQQSLADIEKLPPNDRQEVVEFVNNAASTIKLSDRISKEYERPKARRRISEYSFHEKFLKNQSLQDLILQPVQSNQQSYQREVTPAESEQTIPKLQRKQIVSQLIRNRMIFYKRLKEEKAINLDNDINYKIAKRVLHSLDVGNYELAKNLFKVFVVRRQQETSSTTESYTDVQLPNTIMARKIFYAQKEPLIQFETRRSGKNQLFRPDSLRQLINVKSL